MRVCAQIEITAPASAVWAFVDDSSRYLHFMAGVTRWERANNHEGQPNGLGSRYRILMRVGSAEVGSLIEIVEHDPGRDMAWTSITGIDQRGRWRLREKVVGHGQPRTRVELRLAYGVAGGGIAGLVAERFAARQVHGHLRRSLVELKRQVEHEQLRAAAAARREARAAR